MVAWEALDALSHQLELCHITAETRLTVLVDPTCSDDQLAQIRVAVTRTQARSIEVRVAPHNHADNEPLAAAIDASDVIITTGGHNRRGLGNQVLHLHAIAPHQFAPHASLRRRVQSLVETIEASRTLTISDTNGTELAVTLDSCNTSFDHGFIGAEHRHADFPAGWVAVAPAAATVRGRLVVMPGDANLGARRLISSPVALHLVDDHVSAIEGDSADADVLRALFEHPDDASAYGIASVSIGLNPGDAASGPFDERLVDPVVSRLLAGVVHVSFGENLHADRPCAQTVTVALRSRTVHLDALPVVVDGRLEGDIAPDVYEL